MVLELLFGISAGCVLYPYAVYPLLLAVAGRRARLVPREDSEGSRPTVAVVLAAYNEEATISRRLREFTGQLAASGLPGEVVVVSDGSTDGTAAAARAFADGNTRVVELTENRGKAAALSAGCAATDREILVFADARQTWAPDALARLVENFNDPNVGAVGGELVIESTPGVLAGVGLYWRFETWLRGREGAIHSTVGVSGSISAVRRALFRPIPPGTVLDDVYWPLQVVMQGYRVVHDRRARAFDRLPERVHDEFRRKVRTLGGNFQLLARLPAALLPGRNPIWFAVWSHKVARLAVPWALLMLLPLSAVLTGSFYRVLFLGQFIGCLVGLAGLHPAVAARSRLASAAASFLVLNAAAWLGFWVWVAGKAGKSWRKTHYRWEVEGAAQ